LDRRSFIKILGLSLPAAQFASSFLFADEKDQPEISITIDDFRVSGNSIIDAETCNINMLKALENHSNLKAALFVVGKNAELNNNMELLDLWNSAGHIICNHTYSHKYYPKTNFEDYCNDILKNEELLKAFSRYKKYFRFPALKEGNTLEQRDKMRNFLSEHNYKMGYVTVDASDWYIDQRLKKRIEENAKTDITPYKDYYLNHIWERANYYESLAKRITGRSIKHTLLMHHNILNGLFLNDLLDMFVNKGWKLIDAEQAFADPVFSLKPDIVPAGESIVWALAKLSGKYENELRYPAEDSIYEEPLMNKIGL
jgi:Predicted xylanase/chitin deacetylase